MPKVEYKTRPMTISERQIQSLIIDLHEAKTQLTKVKDCIPYCSGNTVIHTRLTTARAVIEKLETDLNYFISRITEV
jgi:hypothetical protein